MKDKSCFNCSNIIDLGDDRYSCEYNVFTDENGDDIKDEEHYNYCRKWKSKSPFMKESKFERYLDESYRSYDAKHTNLKKEEGHDTYYNILKSEKGKAKWVHVKQFTNSNQADAYANACNKKSTTHDFKVQVD